MSVEIWNYFTLKTITQWKKTTKNLSYDVVIIALGTWVKWTSAV